MHHSLSKSIPASDTDVPSNHPNRAILDALPDMIFRISREGVFNSFEGALDELYRDKSAYLHRRVHDVLPAKTADHIMHHINELFRTGEIQRYEYTLPLNGSLCYYEARMIRHSDTEAVAIVRNITAQKKAELELAAYRSDLEAMVEERTLELIRVEEMYRSMFEYSGAPSIIVEEDFSISMVNEGFEQLSGYGRDEIIQKMRWIDFIAPHNKDLVTHYHNDRQVGKKGRPTEYTCQMVDREGKIKTLFMKVGLLPGYRRTIASLIDITELKQTEEALLERDALYKAMLEGYEGHIYIVSRDFRIKFMNENLVHATGYDATGEVCYRALHRRRSPCPWCVSDQVFEGQSVRFELRNPNDGRWYYSINTPIRHTDGTISYQAMIMDIDDLKQMEEALRESEAYLREENIRLRSSIRERYKFGNIVGKSAPMQEVYENILKAAASDTHIIIYGESGTGKELVARAIHEMSDRSSNQLVTVNCGAISPNLMESEFFGHVKGAFTGATQNKAGFLDLADGGTLLLDEIGEIDLNLQVKLLRAIEGGGFTPVGGNAARKPELRIIAATNRNLAEHVRSGLMREDFFYRIHIIPITLPPLRKRREDIPLLVDHFLKTYAEEQRPPLTGRILEAMMDYDWPGNIRELQNVIHRFVTLKRLEFPTWFGSLKTPPEPYPAEERNPQSWKTALAQFETDFLRSALARHQHNRTATANALGMGLRTLQRKIKQHDL
jgi:PAS domain S-box-containing protein